MKTAYPALALLAAVAVAFLLLSASSTVFREPTGRIAAPEERVVLKPAVAGSFYPEDPGQLRSMIQSYLSEAKVPVITKPRGLVVPHAGYVYSGPVAAYGFRALQGRKYDTVIVIGPSHHLLFNGAVVPNATHYRTPLGDVKISEKAMRMVDRKTVSQSNEPFGPEHSVEVEIPFLQSVLGDFEIIPVLAGRADPRDLARALIPLIDENTLVVASSDLSHYYRYEKAVSLDSNCTQGIPELDFRKMEKCEACGRIPVLTLMYIAREMGWKGILLDYRNSGDTAGREDSVVGYASVAFYREGE